MAHIRTQIRKAIMLALNNTGLNIVDNPTKIFDPEELPCVALTTEDDQNEYQNPTYPRLEMRQLEVHFTVSNLINDNYQDIMDDYILKIEDELGKAENRTLGGIILWHELKGIQTTYEEQGDEVLAQAKMIYIFQFRTIENNHSINA